MLQHSAQEDSAYKDLEAQLTKDMSSPRQVLSP